MDTSSASMAVDAIRKLKHDEYKLLANVLASAFDNDPMALHLFPDQERRLFAMEQMFKIFLRNIYLPHQECYTIGDVWGGALWLPPGKYPASAWQQLAMLPGFIRLFGLYKTPGVFRDMDHLEKMHPKKQAHWYLAFLGVEPTEQGKGIGSALLQPVLSRCDHDKAAAYLETTNERNLSLYQRHGFRVLCECDIPKGPHVWGMWREPVA